MTDRPITFAGLADALDCFWNAALGGQRDGFTDVGCMAEGFAAIATRLKEFADEPEPAAEIHVDIDTAPDIPFVRAPAATPTAEQVEAVPYLRKRIACIISGNDHPWQEQWLIRSSPPSPPQSAPRRCHI